MELKNRVGETYTTTEGYNVEIVEFLPKSSCTIKFENGFIKKGVDYYALRSGMVKYPYHPKVNGVGCIGEGVYKSRLNKKITPQYSRWQDMIERCYNAAHHKKSPTYTDCSVAEEWHNFQNFAAWFYENHIEGFVLDKDILFKGNKVYSPETCCFVPEEVNLLFVKTDATRGEWPIGVRKNRYSFTARLKIDDKEGHLGSFKTPEEAFLAYKIAKEKRIKEVAEKWKDLIDPRVYEAMYKYEVNITD